MLLLLVPAPLQFGARDLGFSYLGSGVRTDKHVVWIDQEFEYEPNMSRKQPDRYKDGPGNCGCRCCMLHQSKSSLIGPQSGARMKPFSLDLPTPVPSRPPKSQPRADLSSLQQADLTADLMDTVARLQNEVYALKLAPSVPPATWTPSARSRPAAFTTTKVPKFSGSTSWDQYRQVFDAIVRSNWWDDATIALQLLSHLEGDALNVALLVPEATRVTRIGLVGALTAHYGSSGRLAGYRRQFEKTVRQDGENPSKFAVARETLAVKACGPNARTWLIRDRFIASHPNCVLRRHLNSVPPEIPIRDIVV